MVNFRKYLTEMTKYSREQKENLTHNILNVIMDPDAARILRKVASNVDKENVTITKKEAIRILNNLKKIRQIVLDLPVEEKESEV